MKTVGVVLAGGLSARMGQDKALLPWQGQTMLERQLGLLHRLKLDNTFVAGTRPGYPHVPDTTSHAGPLSALAGLLERFETGTRLLAIPVDMPLLQPQHLQPLLDAQASPAAYRNNPLPLALTVSDTLIQLIRTRLQKDIKSLKRLWEVAPDACWLDTDGAFLANINTEEEWQTLLQGYGHVS